jgi:hypothetical protein
MLLAAEALIDAVPQTRRCDGVSRLATALLLLLLLLLLTVLLEGGLHVSLECGCGGTPVPVQHLHTGRQRGTAEAQVCLRRNAPKMRAASVHKWNAPAAGDLWRGLSREAVACSK